METKPKIPRLRNFNGLLLGRMALLNAAAVAALALAYLHGLMALVWAADVTYITSAIAVLALYGLGYACWRAVQIARDLNDDGAFWTLPPSLASEAGRLRYKIAPVMRTANLLVDLGLFGTVIGFIMALAGVDASEVSNPSAIGPMVGALMQGMGVALYTTAVGIVGYVWLRANYWMLETALARVEREG